MKALIDSTTGEVRAWWDHDDGDSIVTPPGHEKIEISDLDSDSFKEIADSRVEATHAGVIKVKKNQGTGKWDITPEEPKAVLTTAAQIAKAIEETPGQDKALIARMRDIVIAEQGLPPSARNRSKEDFYHEHLPGNRRPHNEV